MTQTTQSGSPPAAAHQWQVDALEYERHEQRRGRRFAYETVEPGRTALVVIDMVPFFVDQNPYCRGVVPIINRLALELRRAGGIVAWVVPAVRDTPTHWASQFYGADVAAQYATSGGTGDVRSRVDPALDVRDDDVVAEKSAASAFFPGLSPLPDVLSERGVTTVLITGTVTNVCCESAARDASALGYRVIMVADACSATDDDAHNATLRTIYRSFGDVRPSSDVVAMVAHARLGGESTS